jgi:hypothetical protein
VEYGKSNGTKVMLNGYKYFYENGKANHHCGMGLFIHKGINHITVKSLLVIGNI